MSRNLFGKAWITLRFVLVTRVMHLCKIINLFRLIIRNFIQAA